MDPNLELVKQTSIIGAGIFGVAIALTLAFRKTNWGRNITVAIISWAVIFAVFLSTGYAGTRVFGILMAVIALLSVREWHQINGIWTWPNKAIALATIPILAWAAIEKRLDVFYMVPGILALVQFPVRLASGPCEKFNGEAALSVAGTIYWGWLPFHFVLIHGLNGGFGFVILLCILIALNDNSAYYFGKLLGKNSRKFSPTISPGKTWVGAIGGFCFTVAMAFAFKYTVPGLANLKLLGLALVINFSIPVGDLIESAMKRDLDIKDTSTLIPGHGGMMDRFDSWIFTAPIVYYFLKYAYGI